MGMKTQEAPATNTVTNITLADDSIELEAVVVTAFGITRDKKSLGYAAQKLDGSQVNQTPTNNFTNNLAGKVAGLEVRRNANFGGSTNIVLRGTKSITGNNQALMVLDGVPITNTNLNNTDAARGRDGFDFGNSASDIDPNNIESITVLKGAAATALYGSQASNGAIMITTKKGKKNTGIGISLSTTTSVGMIDKSTFPKYQKQYGAGYAGPDSFYSADINGDGEDDLVAPTGDDASFGAAFDPNLMVYQWNAFDPGNPNFGQATPWVAARNDPSKFFRKSFGTVNSVNVNAGDDKGSYNLGFTNNYETGVLPNSRLNKNTISGNFQRQLHEKLRATAFFTYSDQTTIGRNNVGYGDNILTGFRQWWPVNVDIYELRDSYFRNQTNATWNFADPTAGDFSPAYWNNPYWDRYVNYSSDDRNRFIGGGNISYDIFEGFNVMGRVTLESSNDRQEMRKEVGSHAEEFGLQQLQETSGYNLFTRNFHQATYDFIATYDAKLSESIGSKFLAGTTFIRAKVDSFEGSTTGGLAAPGLFTLANSNVFVAPEEEELNYYKFGAYVQASFDWNQTVFLEGSFRRDMASSLPSTNDAYNYYSAGGSFVFSELVDQSWLNLGKLRASYALVGLDPAFGRVGARNNNGLVNNNPTFGNSTVFGQFQNLKPETTRTIEFGLELGMFDRRISLDASIYKSNSYDQIFNVPQSTATGFSFSQINAGELENKGVEVALTVVPVRTKDFEWTMTANWSRNRNKLLELDTGRENLQLASFQDGVSLNATVGQPYGTLRGTDYVYDANGNRVVGEDGYYLQENDQILGNIQADWIGGLYNRVTYKGLSFSFLIDVKKGGDLFSLDQDYGLYTGLYRETTGLNDLGNPIRSPLTEGADSGGVIFPGVNEAGQPNDVRVDGSFAGGAYGNGVHPNKAFIYDASYVKLREVALTYNFPADALKRTFLQGLSVSLTGNNLWIIDKNVPYSDPEAGTSSGNVQGYQSGVMPNEKVYSLNVKLNF